MNTASIIMGILMRQRMKVWSWGMHKASGYENGLEFYVQGFKFIGMVRISYNQGTDLWNIDFAKNGKITKTIEGIYSEDLVDVIDREVEYTGATYKNDVKQWMRQTVI